MTGGDRDREDAERRAREDADRERYEAERRARWEGEDADKRRYDAEQQARWRSDRKRTTNPGESWLLDVWHWLG